MRSLHNPRSLPFTVCRVPRPHELLCCFWQLLSGDERVAAVLQEPGLCLQLLHGLDKVTEVSRIAAFPCDKYCDCTRLRSRSFETYCYAYIVLRCCYKKLGIPRDLRPRQHQTRQPEAS